MSCILIGQKTVLLGIIDDGITVAAKKTISRRMTHKRRKQPSISFYLRVAKKSTSLGMYFVAKLSV